MIRYKQRKTEQNAPQVTFKKPEGMSETVYRLMLARGIAAEAEARAFLNPTIDSLYDPMLLHDMPEAVTRIRRAIADGERICVYGDYDVDGVCASTILNGYLQSVGARSRVYLPSRQSEGYGLNDDAMREIAKDCTLMITVDCGITNLKQVELIKSLGVEVIVTDHHQPGETLPDCLTINPLLGDYPFGYLCGADVAWKLVWALGGREAAMPWIDLAALATVADIVPLRSENRVIAREGLKAMNRGLRLGLQALADVSGTKPPYTANTLGFRFGPRLNAGGRIDSAATSRALLCAEDREEAMRLAAELNTLNEQRREIEGKIFEAALEQLEGFDFAASRILIVAGKDWPSGVIGLAASRLQERFRYPAIVLSDDGEKMTGSCRSIEGVNMHALLTACSDLLVKFGGHRMAAGLTLLPENLEAFKARANAYLWENAPAEIFIPTEEYDLEPPLDWLDRDAVMEMRVFEPTGCENPAPTFLLRKAEVVECRTVGKDGMTLKMSVTDGQSAPFDAVGFRMGNLAESLRDGRADLLYQPEMNCFNGRESVQLLLRRAVCANGRETILQNNSRTAKEQCTFLTEILYNKYQIPETEPQTIGDEALRTALNQSGQGTLILTADVESASEMLDRLEPCALDVYLGQFPEDPRAFNALCVCPPFAETPAGYHTVVLAGMPKGYPMPQNAKVCCMEKAPATPCWIPDLDRMRELYKAIHGQMREGIVPWEILTRELCQTQAIDLRTLTAAVHVLMDAGVLEGEKPQPRYLKRTALKKSELGKSLLWQILRSWKEGGR